MSKKVLVLCQRKSGKHMSYDIERDVVPLIKAMAEKVLGSDQFTMEFLSDKSGHEIGEVDILGTLHSSNEFTRSFIQQSKASGKYDLIILNTCPFQFMDYPVIHKLLKKTGLMIFAYYPKAISTHPQDPPSNLFRKMPHDEFIIYEKISRPQANEGGKTTFKTTFKKGCAKLLLGKVTQNNETTFKKGCAKNLKKTFKTTFKKGCAKNLKKTFKTTFKKGCAKNLKIN
jgi:hypothetical protein